MEFSQILSSNSLAGTATLLRSGRVAVSWTHAVNTTAAAAYVQLFDAAAASDVTLGTTVPTYVLKSAASDPSEGALPHNGLVFALGIVAASTTTATGSTGAAQHVRLGVL